MTTLVYMKGKYLAADKRGIGGELGYVDDNIKLFGISKDNHNIYIATAGYKQMPEKIKSLLEEYFGKGFDPVRLYELKKDLSETNYGSTFGAIVVYKELEFVTDVDGKITTKCTDRAWKITDNLCEEVAADYASLGSGAYLVDGIVLVRPNIKPEELFKLVASKDIYSSQTFDIINLSI